LPTYSYLNLEDDVTPPDWAESIKQYQMDGFLDTGSDCTLVPLEVLSILNLKILVHVVSLKENRSVTISGVGGSQLQGLPCYLNIVVGDAPIKAVRAYGCSWDGLQQRILIGRDVINRCLIELNGMNSTLTINPFDD
jgi:hypothetical protein